MVSKKRMQDFSEQIGGTFDSRLRVVYGKKGQFSYFIKDSVGNGTYMTLHFAVSSNGEQPLAKDFKELRRANKALGSCIVSGYHLCFDIKTPIFGKKITTRVEEAIDAVTQHLSSYGYQNVDELTGQAVETNVYQLSNRLLLVSEETFNQGASEIVEAKNQHVIENTIGGLAGAIIGALIGVIAIVIIGQLGYVAAISGILMGFCTVKGYEILAKRFSKKGLLISIIVMIFMVYFGHQVSYAISVAKYYSVDFFTAFTNINKLISGGQIVSSIYYAELFKLYAFTALGAIPTIINAYKESQMQYDAKQLGE